MPTKNAPKRSARPKEEQTRRRRAIRSGDVAGGDIAGGDIAGRDIVGGDSVRGSKIGGDSIGGDRITVGDVSGGSAVAAGRGASASVSTYTGSLLPDLKKWRTDMEAKIDAQPALSPAEKTDAKEQVAKIEAEASQAEKADPSRLEKLINTLAVMAPDIFEVAIATLANPLGGIGLVIKKIGDKAKLEREAQGAA